MRWVVPAGSSGSLEYDKSGLDVLELCGDVGMVKHDHGLSTLAVRLAIVLYCFLMAITWRLVGMRKALIVSAQPRVESRPSFINLKLGQMMPAKVTVMKMIVAMILRTMGMVVRAE